MTEPEQERLKNIYHNFELFLVILVFNILAIPAISYSIYWLIKKYFKRGKRVNYNYKLFLCGFVIDLTANIYSLFRYFNDLTNVTFQIYQLFLLNMTIAQIFSLFLILLDTMKIFSVLDQFLEKTILPFQYMLSGATFISVLIVIYLESTMKSKIADFEHQLYALFNQDKAKAILPRIPTTYKNTDRKEFSKDD